VAVFGTSPAVCQKSVSHLRAGIPDTPIWLFATVTPPAETAALCECVVIDRSAFRLLLRAQRRLWPVWVALAVTPWTKERGHWAVKLAPFLIPPFHALVINEHGDVFHGGFRQVRGHILHRLLDWARHVCNAAWLLWCDISDLPREAWVRIRNFVFAKSLALSAGLLRVVGYPQHRWFHQLHGRERLTILDERRHTGGLVRFPQHGPDWKGVELESLAAADGVRWLVWQRNGARDVHDSLEDLLPLFQDERTFAVARQTHFRAWKPGILPTAPFRALQPGEACRVLAPLGDTIVVDLPKLAALGIPRKCLAGTGWLEVFWKAAAAGWASYAVGHERGAAQEPDLPMETAEFFWRALRDRTLRRLGAREADLARGTIAFAPALRTWADGSDRKLRVLVVSPFLPYPLAHGGAVRIFNLCRALSDRVDFILAALRERNDVVDYAKLYSVFREVRVVDRDEAPSTEDWLPRQVREYRSRSLAALVRELAEKWRPDVVQIEYTHMAQFRSFVPDIPAVLVEHDVTFTLYRQFVETCRDQAALDEFERWHRFESKWLARFDAVWTVSDDDRTAAVREGASEKRTFVVPNGVDLERFRPCPGSAESPELLYVGSFRHLPNILGFEKLRSDIMPRIWRRFPNLRLRVVAGPDHEKYWRDLGGAQRLPEVNPRIFIHGFVEDLTPLYADAAVVLVPLEVSAGTNIKVLEAMACGKAIVATPIGCAGLELRDGLDALIRPNGAEFAEAVCSLLESSELREDLGASARRSVEARFGWNAIAERAFESYQSLAAEELVPVQ